MLFIFSFFTISSAIAQRPQVKHERKEITPEERATRRADALKAKLLLTDEQTEKIKAAILKSEIQRNNDKEQLRKNREDFDKELSTILNNEQMEKYEAMREENKAKVKARMEERRNQEKIKSEGDSQKDPNPENH